MTRTDARVGSSTLEFSKPSCGGSGTEAEADGLGGVTSRLLVAGSVLRQSRSSHSPGDGTAGCRSPRSGHGAVAAYALAAARATEAEMGGGDRARSPSLGLAQATSVVGVAPGLSAADPTGTAPGAALSIRTVTAPDSARLPAASSATDGQRLRADAPWC